MVNYKSNSALEEYIDLTIRLVRSLVIKSNITAKKINESLIRRYGDSAVMQDYPRTWKYYLNISGQYHSTDLPMKVISLDTHEEIDFTVDELVRHTATAEAYKQGSRYFYSLLRKFPDQVVLILAIINPVNMDEAIDSKDGTILGYDKSLVEPQEDTLIYDLQMYIENYMSRYDVLGFNIASDYYPMLQLDGLYKSLPAKVMNIRLSNCKTGKVHTWHIKQYLASHGRLDKYLPYLTLKQALYLYININYLDRNAGKTEQFKELVDVILTQRRIPLSEYTVRQLQDFTPEVLPELRSRRRSIGAQTNIAESEYVDMEVLYEKEKGVAPGNPVYLDDNKEAMTEMLSTSASSVIQTKVLESAMIDYTDAVPDPMPEVMMRQWAYMSSHGLYDVIVNFTNPINGETYGITAKQALIYYCYLFLKSNDVDVHKVPGFFNVKFRLHPRPLASTLQADIPKEFPDLYPLAVKLVANQPVLTSCDSVTMFRDMSYAIYEESYKHWIYKANTHDPMKRGVVAKMVSRLYGIENIDFGVTQTIEEWLMANNLPPYDYQRADAILLMKEIFHKATGYVIDDTKSLRSIQKALVQLLGQLSSYSIQLLREINDAEIIPLNWAAIRVGVVDQSTDDEAYIKEGVRVQGVTQTTLDNVSIDDPGDYIHSELILVNQEIPISTDVDVVVSEYIELDWGFNIPANQVTDYSDLVTDQQDPFHGMEYYLALSQAQIQTIANVINKRSQ